MEALRYLSMNDLTGGHDLPIHSAIQQIHMARIQHHSGCLGCVRAWAGYIRDWTTGCLQEGSCVAGEQRTEMLHCEQCLFFEF